MLVPSHPEIKKKCSARFPHETFVGGGSWETCRESAFRYLHSFGGETTRSITWSTHVCNAISNLLAGGKSHDDRNSFYRQGSSKIPITRQPFPSNSCRHNRHNSSLFRKHIIGECKFHPEAIRNITTQNKTRHIHSLCLSLECPRSFWCLLRRNPPVSIQQNCVKIAIGPCFTKNARETIIHSECDLQLHGSKPSARRQASSVGVMVCPSWSLINIQAPRLQLISQYTNFKTIIKHI